MRDCGKQLDTAYQSYRTTVYHTAMALVKNTATAEDVMQDVFLTYYHQLLAGITIHNLKAWLLSVTKHKSLNVLRDSGREVCQEDFLMAETADDAAGIGKDELVWQLLAQLTDQERLAFSLHYLDGYTYKEIAVGLAIPIGTVQTRCRLARKKLKNSLQNTTEEKETWP